MRTEYNKAVQQFRVNIRRKHLEQIFENSRNQIQDRQEATRINHLKQQLQNQNKKQQLIISYAQRLQGQINNQWQQIITNLYYLVKIYEHQHDLWIKYGILRQITNLYKLQTESQDQLGHLLPIVSNILTDIFYLNSMEHPNIIKTLLSYSFIDHFIEVMKQTALVEHFRLLAKLVLTVPELRAYLYNQNCLLMAIQMTKKTGEARLIGFHIIYGFVKIHEIDQNTSLTPRKNCVYSIIEFLGSFFIKPQGLKVDELILRSFDEICRLKKEDVYGMILKDKNIIRRAIAIMSESAQRKLRKAAGRFVAQLLMSSNPTHIQAIFNEGIIDKILHAYRNHKSDEDTANYLSILINLTADDPAFQNCMVSHPLFQQLIVQEAQNSIDPRIRKQAVYCICNFLTDKTTSYLEGFLQKYRIIEILVQNIQKEDIDAEGIEDILKIWREMIEIYDQQLGMNENTVYIGLVGYYRIEQYLAETIQNEGQTEIEYFLEFLNNYRQ